MPTKRRQDQSALVKPPQQSLPPLSVPAAKHLPADAATLSTQTPGSQGEAAQSQPAHGVKQLVWAAKQLPVVWQDPADLGKQLPVGRPGPWQDPKDAPREKLLRLGAEPLSDSELLAIFLRVGYKDKNVRQLAEELVAEKGLSWLLTADFKDFCAHKGLGPAVYVQLRAVMELARRYLEVALKRESGALNSNGKITEYLCYKLGDSQREKFACLFLDNDHQVLEYKELFAGTLDAATIYPREIIAHALRANAASMVMAHNHPSGDPWPSAMDKEMTKHVKQICDLMDIHLIDHIIVSGNQRFSFAAEGLLPPPPRPAE